MQDFGFYFRFGWDHIIDNGALDHIFFIAALAAIYMLKDWKQVLILVTAFTVGHAITMILSSKNMVDINSEWVEFLIPCTIMVTGITNLFQKTFTHRAIRINYFLALFFGLIHGLAYANLIKFMITDDQSFIWTWFSFSVGLEAGQILVVFLILLLAQLFVAVLKINRRYWVMIVSIPVIAFALKMALERIP
ncbi:MAG TPA: HupE/UreJ family protein [Flavisolibacter sp.]